MNRTPDYGCPKCNGKLVGTSLADWRCVDCEVLIKERGGELKVDVEPDGHGSRIETYERNHVSEGMGHE